MNSRAVTVGDIADIVMGQAPPSSQCNTAGEGLPFVKAGEFSTRHPTVREWTTRPLKMAKPDDILVCVVGATCGKVNRANAEYAIGRSVAAVRPRAGVDSDFMYRFLQTQTGRLRRGSQGLAQGVITREMLGKVSLVLPPIEEQRRIAAILDQADALRAKRREALAHLDDLTQSIFLDMFGDAKSLPIPLADVVTDMKGGKSLVGDDPNASTTNRVLKISAVTSNHFRPGESKPVPDTYVPDASHFVRTGDLLFSRANTTELVGAVAYVWSAPDNLLLPDKLWRFVWRDPSSVDPLFVWALFRTREVRQELSSRSSGTGGSMKNISKAKLMQMPVRWAGPLDQARYGNAVRRVRAVAGAQTRASEESVRLFSALQSRAFSGRV